MNDATTAQSDSPPPPPEPFTLDWLDRMNELLRHCGMKVKEFGMIIPTELSVVSSVGIVVERFDKKPADPVLIPIRTLKGAA